MKQLIALFVCLFCLHSGISQTVVSSCSASDSIKALYFRDADRLALRKIYAQNLSDTNNIIIPQSHADTVLKALIAVYNATALPARNAVISQYNIHAFPLPNVALLNVAADSNLTWMQQLKLGNIPTGNTQVDNLISAYSLTIQSYNRYFGIFPWHLVTFTSDSSYNLPPLADLFENLSGVSFSEPKSVIGDGHNITASIYPNYVQLDYSLGWQDCPSGCLNRHYWTFNVYYNCTVEYLGESGTPLPIVQVPTISVSGLLCVNKKLTVTISGASSYSLNNQSLSASQFTLSSPTPTSYIISASNSNYPATAISFTTISIINCNNTNTTTTTTTSIIENKWYSDISVYPNPANLNFELSVNNDEVFRKTISMSIFNQLGQLVKKEDIFYLKNKTTIIDVSELEEGVYSILLVNSDEQTIIKKLLISR